MGVREGDELLTARLTDGNSQLLIASRQGMVMRCDEKDFRPMGRGASGVKGINLQPQDDYVVGMLCVQNEEEDILVVSENGFGKRSAISDYRKTKRASKGVVTLKVTEKTGRLVAIENVTDENDLMIINRSGITIRLHLADMPTRGRNTQGLKLINLRGKDYIASITKVDRDPVQEETTEQEGTPEQVVMPEQEGMQTDNDVQDDGAEN